METDSVARFWWQAKQARLSMFAGATTERPPAALDSQSRSLCSSSGADRPAVVGARAQPAHCEIRAGARVSWGRMTSGRLEIRDFAQIREANLQFRDLTVLVGAQGTGKSLILQWLKAAIDGKQIVKTLLEAGQEVSPRTLIDLIFGVGMGNAWRAGSHVTFDGKAVSPTTIERRGNGVEQLFFIPAHRSMLISDGWATPFQKLTAETPVVARLFSQNLFERFNAREGARLFPLNRTLKKVYRELVDDAVFHGGMVGVEQNEQLTKRLRLRFKGSGDTSLPFMTWTAGQREFTPLLLGLYHLFPPRAQRKDDNVDWVIVEEPEMGLHPQAVTVFMLLVLDLLWRGYRVVLSTHSPIVITALWALQRLATNQASSPTRQESTRTKRRRTR